MNNLVVDKSKSVCYTGHRSNKLVSTEETCKRVLGSETRAAINEGYTHFLVGMADGVDLISAEIVLHFKERFPKITLECCVPYKGYRSRIPKKWKERYDNILKHADIVTTLYDKYNSDALEDRNEYMVDHSNLVLCIYNGFRGGTRNCLDYAYENNIEVRGLGCCV